ncbi:MAG: hypothetical protein AVDCRST_MAG85-4193, partial [uncultured Solirubrobacteraceae bacterium]
GALGAHRRRRSLVPAPRRPGPDVMGPRRRRTGGHCRRGARTCRRSAPRRGPRRHRPARWRRLRAHARPSRAAGAAARRADLVGLRRGQRPGGGEGRGDGVRAEGPPDVGRAAAAHRRDAGSV